jgi:hypothetical protein
MESDLWMMGWSYGRNEMKQNSLICVHRSGRIHLFYICLIPAFSSAILDERNWNIKTRSLLDVLAEVGHIHISYSSHKQPIS